MNNLLNVYSEIGRLKRVLLHRPGFEIENLTPELMERLLFDDIPYLKVAREEHDAFAKVFEDQGVQVSYLENLIAESLNESDVKNAFIKQFLLEAGIKSDYKVDHLTEYFNTFGNNREMIDKMMAGLRTEEMELHGTKTLQDMVDTHYPFIIDPMPNLYFTRDPFATIGNGVSLNKMRTVTRNRETLFASYIFKYHPEFMNTDIPMWYNRTDDFSIEGGDELILSDKVIAIGISERTDAAAIDLFARRLFARDDHSFETVLAFDIPKTRAFMHLDTVFTMVDYDKFTIHPEIEGPLNVYSLKRGARGNVEITHETETLDKTLAKYLEVDHVELIRCGGKLGIDAGREQWNDGSNTLAIAPGEVIVYSRNHVTNDLLDKKGIKLHIIPSSELSRGRGGPRCMSMPLYRDNL